MTLALEPWWARGSNELSVDPDGWTLRSADGSMTAHTEHTIAITEDGLRILTRAVAGGRESVSRRRSASVNSAMFADTTTPTGRITVDDTPAAAGPGRALR